MSTVNKVILVGYLGMDPELRTLPSGTPVATFSLATSQRWTDKNGVKQEATEWHRIVVWGRSAEIVRQYLTKGRLVCVEGRIRSSQWQDEYGQKRSSTQIVAQRVQMLGARKDTQVPAEPEERSAVVELPDSPVDEPVAVGIEDGDIA